MGIAKGYYEEISKIEEELWECDLCLMSLGAGVVGLKYWLDECVIPPLADGTLSLGMVKKISITTGGEMVAGVMVGAEGFIMRKRVRRMLRCMNLKEEEQSDERFVRIDKDSLVEQVERRHDGKLDFDSKSYRKFRKEERMASVIPDVVQV